MPKKSVIERDELYQLYVVEKRTAREIAEMKGMRNQQNVFHYLRKYNIPSNQRTRIDMIRSGIERGKKYAYAKGENSVNWKGGRRINSSGYVEIHRPDHPRARSNGYIFEHFLVWEDHNGAIPSGWHIHHINGDKTDNRIENLRAMPSKDHMRYLASQQEVIRGYETRIAELEAKVKLLEKELSDLKQM